MEVWKQMNHALWVLWMRLVSPQELHYINGSDTLPAPLESEQEQQALADLAAGRSAARDL